VKRAQAIGAIAAAWISLVVPALCAGQSLPAEIRSNGQSVTLVARMPETASMAWLVTPVPQASLQDGQAAELVVLQQTLAFERGQTVTAQGQIVAGPEATAQVFTSKPQQGAGSALVNGVNQVRTFPLVSGFDPAQGSARDTQILLIRHEISTDDVSATLRITMVAL
jgi:hypothetical protein